MLACRDCETQADRDAAMAIRFEVFVDEQRVPAELEPDAYDADAVHLLAINEHTGEAIGTARIVDKGNGVAKIGRVAVRRAWRGHGVGEALMRRAINRAQAEAMTAVILDAQVPVIPFYERLGFVAEGPLFDDAGIPHRRMTRRLG
jgi:predicted GNAT family N-acyltransferase